MNRAIVIALAVVGCFALIGGAGYGGWYAWDHGLIPGNKRAPTVESMLAPAKRSAQARARTQPRACLGPDMGRVQPDQQGRPGIAPRNLPGQHAIAYLVQGAPFTQDARERLLQQYGFLAQQGFYTEADVTVETDSGPRPAKEYRLTWKGFAAQSQEYNPCFAIGRREFSRIEKIERVPGDALGMELWEVSYQNVPSGVPDWAQTPQAKTLFPRYAEATATRTDKVRLMRGKEGWITEQEMQAQLQAAQVRSTGQDPAAVSAQMARARQVPEAAPDAPEVKRLLDEFLASEQWQSRSMAACLPMQLQRGGDERGMALPYDPTSSFYAVWFDAPLTVRRDYERNLMLTQLHILSALEAAGLATMEKAKPGTVNGQPVSTGVRFDVKPEALEPLGLRGNACMAVGRIGKVELAGFAESSPNNVRIALRGEVTQVQPWAQALAQWLPALKALLEEGVPFIGQIVFSPVYDRSSGTPGETKWHLSGLSPAYPQVQFTSVPPALQPLLPLTTQASLKPARALGGFSSVPMAIPPSQAIPAPSQMIAPRVQVAPAPGSPMRAVPAPSRP